MKLNIISVAAAIAFASGTAAAFAQTQSTPSWRNNPGSAYNPAEKPPGIQDDLGGAEAKKTPPGSHGVVGQYDLGGAQSPKNAVPQKSNN